jgi:hypothetical protein
MSVELKIKAKHLATEPAIIRKEEQKILKQIKWLKQQHQIQQANMFDDMFYPYHRKWWNLQHHRKTVVRNESRATHLARAYLAGIPYEKVEKKIHDDTVLCAIILPRVYNMVAKYQDKPLQKRWNRDRNMFAYNEDEFKQLQDSIKAWCGQ